MNYFYKRHLWLVPLCIVAIWGIWAIQLVSAQVDKVDLTASPDNLSITSTDIVTVTITYTVTESTQLFYNPPVDFEVVSNDGAVKDPTNALPSGLNDAETLMWNVEGSGTKEITLRVKDDATSGEKPHHVILNGTPVEKVLTLEPADPNLQIISAEAASKTVVPGQPFTVTIVIQNTGEGPANDVKIDLTSDSLVFDRLQRSVGSIEAGQSITQSYPVTPAVSTEDGSYRLTVILPNGETPYDTKSVTITVKQPLPAATLVGSTSSPVPSPQPTTTTATPKPEDGANDDNVDWWRWFWVGVIIVAVLLLVVIGIYLWPNARKQAKNRATGVPKKRKTIVSGGQPYLQASNGSSFPITTFPFTIGRGESNNLIIDETFPQWESMSRIHAQIVQHQQGYVIEDLGSQNKLRVQGRLTDRNLLRNGWQILIGGVKFTFYDGSVTPGGPA